MTGHRPLKIGVVGLGFGVDVHVPGFRSLPDVRVVALLGKNREKASDAERRSGISATTCSERFFDRELDAVSVAVIDAGIAIGWIQGRHRSLAKLDRLLRAARSARHTSATARCPSTMPAAKKSTTVSIR